MWSLAEEAGGPKESGGGMEGRGRPGRLLRESSNRTCSLGI